jgi:hypothetical protein
MLFSVRCYFKMPALRAEGATRGYLETYRKTAVFYSLFTLPSPRICTDVFSED